MVCSLNELLNLLPGPMSACGAEEDEFLVDLPD